MATVSGKKIGQSLESVHEAMGETDLKVRWQKWCTVMDHETRKTQMTKRIQTWEWKWCCSYLDTSRWYEGVSKLSGL